MVSCFSEHTNGSVVCLSICFVHCLSSCPHLFLLHLEIPVWEKGCGKDKLPHDDHSTSHDKKVDPKTAFKESRLPHILILLECSVNSLDL